MSRWPPNTRERLERAALELFLARGFTETTVPEIAEAAGLTTRTFFRYFADKREVLFGGQSEFAERMTAFVTEAPAGQTPLDVVGYCLRSVAESAFEGRAERVRMRRRVIDADDGLRERDLRKLDTLAQAVTRGLMARGEEELTAAVAADLGVTVFRLALARWLEDEHADERRLTEIIADVLAAVPRCVATTADRSPTH